MTILNNYHQGTRKQIRPRYITDISSLFTLLSSKMATIKSTMLCSKSISPRILLRNNSTVSTASVNSFKKTEVDENAKPEGWDQAKPFEEIPGIKPLPLIGNNFRFLPGGEFHKIQGLEITRK